MTPRSAEMSVCVSLDPSVCFFCYLSLRCHMRRPAQLRSASLKQPRQGQVKVRVYSLKHINLGDSYNQILQTNALILMYNF